MKIRTYLLLAAGVLATVSCDNDDQNGPSDDDEVAGVYRITSWNSPVSQDLDNDGDSSLNLVTEHSCYAEGMITLNADNTYTSTDKIVAANDGVISCNTSLTTSGTWEVSGSNIILTNTSGGSSGIETTYTYSEQGHILTHTGPGMYPIIFENVITLESGTVTMVFVKE